MKEYLIKLTKGLTIGFLVAGGALAIVALSKYAVDLGVLVL